MGLLPGVFERNWQLKVLALAVAVLLWTVPRFEAQDTRVLEDIPVLVDLVDPEWARVGDPVPASVSVTLSGPARDLMALGVDRPPIYIPVAEVSKSDTTILLSRSWFRTSGLDGVVVEALDPLSVELRFEPKEDRALPLSAPLYGQLPDGYSLAGPPVITPAVATMIGPVSAFEGLDSLPLVPIDRSLVSGPGPYTQPVDTAGLEGFVVTPLEATVEFPLEVTAQRVFADQPVVLPVLPSDPQLQVRPASVTVILSGAPSLIESIAPEDLRVTVPAGQAILAPGGELRVNLVVDGVPELVTDSVPMRLVLLRRPAGQ
ncbi:MAG: hypothetical protein HKO65_13030 [Gemmatimonadetes bacterium]|nr:hypothetical protein [Gemmatimonadota bacterium]NNM06006.1 hypothetical protein [Gemmatimonadota bacterium]